jgi:hypothetical protein
MQKISSFGADLEVAINVWKLGGLSTNHCAKEQFCMEKKQSYLDYLWKFRIFHTIFTLWSLRFQTFMATSKSALNELIFCMEFSFTMRNQKLL